ncbi:carboxymuconolactone decarboxylase family protein [Aeromonas sanarellii]|uniref:carboxymuconolactone decarboxylase family protein n=1 Tax=Aeromonas sanarellii TaxID=633415 RepID=UPI0038CF5FED
MSQRIQLASQIPAAIQAMRGLEAYLGGTDIPLSLKELIKLRASMINGCAYCIEMHAEVAMKHGESAQRLLAQCLMQAVTINAWNRIAVATRMEHAHP